jgi:hypothetical protein
MLQRLIIVVTLLIGGFFLAVFQASLTAALTAADVESEFRSIDNVKSCNIGADRICYPRATAVSEFWNESIAGSLGPSCQTIVSSRPDNTEDAFKLVNSDTGCDFYFAAGAEAVWFVTGEYCKRLTIAGSSFYNIERSFILPKGSPLTHEMTLMTLKLRESGQLQSAAEYTKSHRQDCPEAMPSVKMTWEKLAGFFILTWMVLLVFFALRMASCATRWRRTRTASDGVVLTETMR